MKDKVINKAAKPKVEAKPVSSKKSKKLRHQEANITRYDANRALVTALNLPREEVVRTVSRTHKKGSKVIVDTITVSKTKRPSKMLRKYRRRDVPERQKQLSAQIASLEAKVNKKEVRNES